MDKKLKIQYDRKRFRNIYMEPNGKQGQMLYIYCEHTIQILTDALTVKDREIIESINASCLIAEIEHKKFLRKKKCCCKKWVEIASLICSGISSVASFLLLFYN